MKLLTLHLQNFAGVRDSTLTLNGSDATIRGTNASGKTTHFTAFTWLLFGKDARGQAQFDIKTITPDGEPLHNLEHTVEGTFQIGDDTLTLRKTYVEVWTRKRGSTSDEFTGHRVDHYLDGVPVQKKEYDARISEIAPEGTFRLLTDPDAFMALHWQERRRILLDVCGDVSDADVIASTPDLADLPGILGKRSLEEHRKVVDARRKELNRELQAIPVRIDEATNGRPSLPDEPREKLEATLGTLRDARTALERQRAQLEAGGAIAELQAKQREIDGKLADVVRSVTASAEEKLAAARKDRAARAEDAATARRAVEHLQREIADAEAGIQHRDKQLEDLRTEWAAVNDRPEPHSSAPDTCPACGQALPIEQITAAHERAREEWNARQAAELERIQALGHERTASRDRMAAEVEELNTKAGIATEALEKAEHAYDAADAKADALAKAIPDPTADPRHQTLTSERARIQAKIDDLRTGNTTQVAELRADVAKLDAEIHELVQAIGAFDLAAKADARIEQLSEQEKALAIEFEDLEHQLHLLDLFTRAKADMLTDRINSRFAITRWRLFATQVNGGLVDECTATVNGVPYGTGLNRAARINAGLDVLRVLQEHYKLWPCTWVDESESVVETLPLDCQLIKLVVDERYKELHVELDREAVAA